MSPVWSNSPNSSHKDILIEPVLSATLTDRTTWPSFVWVGLPELLTHNQNIYQIYLYVHILEAYIRQLTSQMTNVPSFSFWQKVHKYIWQANKFDSLETIQNLYYASHDESWHCSKQALQPVIANQCCCFLVPIIYITYCVLVYQVGFKWYWYWASNDTMVLWHDTMD